jgi:O-glycosyl hydrolase
MKATHDVKSSASPWSPPAWMKTTEKVARSALFCPVCRANRFD